MYKKRSDLIVGSHLNIYCVIIITTNYDELNRLYRGSSHAAILVDLGAGWCFESNYVGVDVGIRFRA